MATRRRFVGFMAVFSFRGKPEASCRRFPRTSETWTGGVSERFKKLAGNSAGWRWVQVETLVGAVRLNGATGAPVSGSREHVTAHPSGRLRERAQREIAGVVRAFW